jgi:hypothetical protein
MSLCQNKKYTLERGSGKLIISFFCLFFQIFKFNKNKMAIFLQKRAYVSCLHKMGFFHCPLWKGDAAFDLFTYPPVNNLIQSMACPSTIGLSCLMIRHICHDMHRYHATIHMRFNCLFSTLVNTTETISVF